jgi:AraC family transcriptional regulator, transcriptional activator of pobA
MNHYTNLTDLHAAYGFPPPENPMISVLCDAVRDINFGTRVIEHTSDFYIIAFKKMKSGALTYGRTKYDHASGSMFFVSPRQIIALDDIERQVKGFMIYFHEDFLNGHPLHDE